ncbi:SH3 domain-containing protein [Streptomyces sp. Li-HN-5-11]|uniref:SH3 domain-containing protein n=1 Tax=Streptomyces sp. Li-HN-5-11 TaxID=3075432 RepID=UPI0028B01549|nr:SH3 domain-containing protein [Streptomyces sp. Li-HN-5-11]WNM32006.1 SH3 domain-containing protein [Streptomyces sp. Li-HN-5-11]WOP39221.1 SH3 domain-containing protein [Streptomyces sp. Li-HN-5-13]
MIRRTLTGGLLATVAVLALVPTAAGAAQAAPAPLSAASAISPHLLPALPSAPVRHTPAVHRVSTARHSRHVDRPAVHRRSVHPLGRVVTRRLPLNVRSGPGTGYRVIGVRHTHRLVALTCRTYGSWVHGTRQWYRLTHRRGYVSAHYVRVSRTVPWC